MLYLFFADKRDALRSIYSWHDHIFIYYVCQNLLNAVKICSHGAAFEMGDLLKETDLLRLLSLSRTTLWNLRKQGKIPYYKIGGQYRYDKDEVLRALRIEAKASEPPQTENQKVYRAIDLFAGIGGIRLGFEQAFQERIRFVYSNDNNKACCQTYAANFGEIDCRDINDVIEDMSNIPEHDLLLAGFPCQPFSIAGEKRGFEDKTRGTLFYAIARILNERKPAAFLLENVAYFEHHDNGRTWTTVRDVLRKELGYIVFHTVLNAKYFGVPQNRPRFFVAGFKEKAYGFSWPTQRRRMVKLKDFLETDVEPKYYLGQKYLESLKKHRKRHESLGHGFGYVILNPEKNTAHTLVAGGMGKERNLIQNTPLPDCWKPGDDPLKKKNNEGVRRLTPLEFCRLQGFPDSFKIPVSDTQAYRQFANSVAVPVIRAIAKNVLYTLERLDKHPPILSYA